MVNQGYAAYKTASIDTADQSKLILMTYDAAIKNCKLALDIFDDPHKLEARVKFLYKVQDAITELMSALNLDTGDIAKNLYSLYDYMLRSVIDGAIRNKKDKIIEIQKYLEDLR
ncbi:MAG: flagellar export chaperone FliS, partial [Fibrobacter sp.]|nr:flagellar export chaperone FliS [Fibrobacter sp.]